MPDPSAAPHETIERPEPGLARGRWEAPRWAFMVTPGVVIAGALVWLALALRVRRSAG